ncbi:AMP-binding protein [Micromonospora sp. U21]|uniref:AMP-binding protein n=1 Tax=Micromonospora sp. U21 TaxID=2824899 RepID=UPI0027DC3967|nr:AMP-binding protein [Micromonospora sp. U21]
MFESACDKDPSAIALECGDEQLTYRELDEHANRLAHHLRSFGVVGGARVAILPQRSVDTYVALLGVGKAGAAFVPIDPESPATICSTDGHAPGAWAAIHDALRDLVRVYEGRDPLPTAAVIDSQSVRAGDTVTRASRGYDAGKKINGRKRHIAVDTGGLVLAVIVTIAAVQDRDAGHRILAPVRRSSPPSRTAGPMAATPGAWSSGHARSWR